MKKQQGDQLIDQFYMTLSATYQQIQENNQNLNEHTGIKSKIEDMLQGVKSWRTAYQIEQLMVPLLNGDILDIVLTRNILEAKKLGQEVIQYYENQAETATTYEGKQALLGQLIQDLQWHDEISRVKQSYVNNAWLIVSYAFVSTFLVFFLPNLIPVMQAVFNKLGEGGGRAADIYTAITSGALGASFSMLIGLKGRIENSSLDGLRMMQRTSYAVSRVVTGIGAGLIFFYFLQSGLLEGAVFPEFISNSEKSSPVLVHKDNRSLALLVIWCFLSGFSEKLVPNILSKTEEQAM